MMEKILINNLFDLMFFFINGFMYVEYVFILCNKYNDSVGRGLKSMMYDE